MPRASPTYPGLLHPGAENVYFASVVKPRRPAILVALMCALACMSLRAEVELTGYLITGSQAKFVLRDAETGKTSDWLAVGDTFQDYTIADFDPVQEVVALEKAGERRSLRMKPGAVVGYDPAVFAREEAQRVQALAQKKAARKAQGSPGDAARAAKQALIKAKDDFLKRKAREDAVKYAHNPETRNARAQLFLTMADRWMMLKEKQRALELDGRAKNANWLADLNSELAQLERGMAD